MTGTTEPAVRTEGLVRRFGSFTAVDHVDITLEADRIHGLLGRNGAGKTTLMQLVTGQDFPTAGTVQTFGRRPNDDPEAMRDICFIKESQRYPDIAARHVLTSAAWFFERWDADFAAQLADELRLPLKRPIKKLSRGQRSAIGVVVGLASRAPLTFVDEPYLGLDAVARQLFYDRLLADYAEHPRTIVLSTHLIDEVANLLEHVVVIDDGRIVVDADADDLRGAATVVSGRRDVVERFASRRHVLHREGIGSLAAATVEGLSTADRAEAESAGLDLAPVSLQQLVVRKTGIETHELEPTA